MLWDVLLLSASSRHVGNKQHDHMHTYTCNVQQEATRIGAGPRLDKHKCIHISNINMHTYGLVQNGDAAAGGEKRRWGRMRQAVMEVRQT